MARPAMALRPGPYGPVPAAPVLALGAVGAVPPGLGVVEGGAIPYKPEALAKKKENQENWLERDPEIKCYLPGVPRATYMPLSVPDSPEPERDLLRVRVRGRRAQHLPEGSRPGAGRLVDGPVGRPLGRRHARRRRQRASTTRTWFDRVRQLPQRRSCTSSSATRGPRRTSSATKRRSRIRRRFTRPWKISMPLYRRLEKNAQLMDFKCVEFVEELLYGQWRKKPLTQVEKLAKSGVQESGMFVMARLFTAAGGRGGAIASLRRCRRRSPARRRSRPPAAAKRAIPRTADGHPDLQGMYDLATLTPVERPAGTPLVLTDEEAAKLEQQVAARKRRSRPRRSTGDRDAPPIGGDGSAGAAGNVGGYNSFWIDSGSRYYDRRRPEARVDRHRSAGRPRAAADAGRRGSGIAAQRAADLGSVGTRGRPGLRGRRRLRRSRAAAARRALPARLRLDVRSAGAAELLLQQPPPDRADAGLGDDPHRDGPRRAHRPDERRAPAVDHPQMDGRFDRPLGRRHAGGRHDEFHRQDALPRLHARTCTSSSASRASTRRRCSTGSRSRIPTTWTKPWTGEYTWPATDELMYEYACHEGNYALGNILRGARLKEAERREENKQ